MNKYQVTIAADTLEDLAAALAAYAALIEYGFNRAIATELSAYAVPASNGAEQAPLPTPPPDYQAAGLTEWQAVQARAAAAQPAAVAVAPAATPGAAIVAAPAPVGEVHFCPIHGLAMEWKAGAISPKSGKALPLWSCPRSDCRQAIWPPR